MANERFIGAGVSHKGIPHDEFMYPFVLASGVSDGDQGKPVKMGSNNYEVDLAGDGDDIIGFLVSFEDRQVEGIKVGTVQIKGPVEFTFATGDTVAVGDSIVGAGSGEVKKATTPSATNRTLVVSKNATAETVVVHLL